MPKILPGEIQERVIEKIVAQNADARFFQHWLCPTCEKAISQSSIIAGRAGELLGVSPRREAYSLGGQEVTETIDHHQSTELLFDSLLQGCHLCSLLSAGIQERTESSRSCPDPKTVAPSPQFPQTGRSQTRLLLRVSCETSFYKGRVRQESGCMSLWKRRPDGTEIEYGSKGFIDVVNKGDKWSPKPDKSYDLHKTAPDTLFSLSTASPASFRWAKSLLDECQSRHNSCSRAYKSAIQAPTRLLDLDGVESKGRIRLVVVDHTKGARPEYLTLSHRWGNKPTVRLLQGNEADFTESISMQGLPLTFQHAVTVTVRLGFRYLWIDSLCIIQDLLADWERESAIMGDIYRGSICTIAACSAMDSHEGFFSSRNPLLDLPCRLNEQVGVVNCFNFGRLPADYLSSRGWVVQERALSSRTLFYRAGAISWECVETEFEERGVKEQADQPKSRFYNLSLIKLGKLDLSTPSESLLMFHTYWTKLLGFYSATHLTRPSDRLVAISGVISKIRQSTQLTPLAGLWKEILPAELLWKAEDVSHLLQMQEHRAPSWSWASFDGRITNQWVKLARESHDFKWKIDVLEAEAAAAPSGQVFASYLHLRGPLRRVREAKSNADGQQQSSVLSAKLWTADNGIREANEELWALLIVRAGRSGLRETASGLELSMVDVGLILAPVEGSKNAFQRRGYYEESFWPSGKRHIFWEGEDKDVKTFTFL